MTDPVQIALLVIFVIEFGYCLGEFFEGRADKYFYLIACAGFVFLSAVVATKNIYW